MRRKFFAILLITTLMIGCFTVISFGASKTKSMKAYSCIRNGNSVYCAASGGIYKVDVSSKAIKRLAASPDNLFHEAPKALYLYKGNIYYLASDGIDTNLYRVSTSGGGKKKLASEVKSYAISKSKIFYKATSGSKTVKKQMKLSGKSKKSSKYNVKLSKSKTNSAGCYVYSRKDKEARDKDGGEWMTEVSYTDLLMLPDGSSVELCRHTDLLSD